MIWIPISVYLPMCIISDIKCFDRKVDDKITSQIFYIKLFYIISLIVFCIRESLALLAKEKS